MTLSGEVFAARTVYILLGLVVFAGCSYFVSWDDKSKRSIGLPIEGYIRLNGSPDEIRDLPDGQKEYKYHLKKIDPSCVHYWIVDKNGIRTGYRYTGYCRPIG